METFISVLAGGAITFLVSLFLYLRASEELRAESRELRRLTGLILDALDNANLASVVRDKQGNVQGIRFTLKADDLVTGAPVLGKPALEQQRKP